LNQSLQHRPVLMIADDSKYNSFCLEFHSR
jgi:hypothetical protein